MMTRPSFSALLLCVPLLYGCSSLPSSYNAQIIEAETYLQNGQHKEAALIYQQLAAYPSDQQNQFRLLTADAFIKANNVTDGKKTIEQIALNLLTDAQLNHLNLLQAQIDLSAGNAERALAQLKVVQTQLFDAQTATTYYQSLAFAHSLTGHFFDSAEALLNLETYLKPAQLPKHYEAILRALSSLSSAELQAQQATENPTLKGWLALAMVFKQPQAELNSHLQSWKQTYLTHSANTAFLDNYVKNYQPSFAQAQIIAMLLPKSGDFAKAAKVIREGFVKAYKVAKAHGETNAEIRFYDSTRAGAVSLYKQVVKEGAELVIGPLDKNQIKELVTGTALTVPVLALNHVEGLSNPKLYQFGLSPIDDAQSCAIKAKQNGHQNAVLLVPQTEQGKRFESYLTDGWKSLGGTIDSVQSYDEAKNDFSTLIAALNKSTDNGDVILLNAYTKQARNLAGRLLDNPSTAGIPVYATSQIYSGDVNETRDDALSGITFCDVPWMFPQAYGGELSKTNLQESWQALAPSYLRLLPFGIDAYNIVSHLAQLKTQSYTGATGKLSLGKENKIDRELYCAKFVNGIPKPLNFAAQDSVDISPPVQPVAVPVVAPVE